MMLASQATGYSLSLAIAHRRSSQRQRHAASLSSPPFRIPDPSAGCSALRQQRCRISSSVSRGKTAKSVINVRGKAFGSSAGSDAGDDDVQRPPNAGGTNASPRPPAQQQQAAPPFGQQHSITAAPENVVDSGSGRLDGVTFLSVEEILVEGNSVSYDAAAMLEAAGEGSAARGGPPDLPTEHTGWFLLDTVRASEIRMHAREGGG